jgi:hypothetical protein
MKCRFLGSARGCTMDIITTHGKFNDLTIARARDVFPEPELPATPIILAFPQGGE